MTNAIKINLINIWKPSFSQFHRPILNQFLWFSHNLGGDYIISKVSVNCSFASDFSMSNLLISQSYMYKTSFLISSRNVCKQINLPFYGRIQELLVFCTWCTEKRFPTTLWVCVAINIHCKHWWKPTVGVSVWIKSGTLHPKKLTATGTSVFMTHRKSRLRRCLCLAPSLGKRGKNKLAADSGKLCGKTDLGWLCSYPTRERALTHCTVIFFCGPMPLLTHRPASALLSSRTTSFHPGWLSGWQLPRLRPALGLLPRNCEKVIHH